MYRITVIHRLALQKNSGVQVCRFVYGCCIYAGKGNVVKLRLGDVDKIEVVLEKIELKSVFFEQNQLGIVFNLL